MDMIEQRSEQVGRLAGRLVRMDEAAKAFGYRFRGG